MNKQYKLSGERAGPAEVEFFDHLMLPHSKDISHPDLVNRDNTLQNLGWAFIEEIKERLAGSDSRGKYELLQRLLDSSKKRKEAMEELINYKKNTEVEYEAYKNSKEYTNDLKDNAKAIKKYNKYIESHLYVPPISINYQLKWRGTKEYKYQLSKSTSPIWSDKAASQNIKFLTYLISELLDCLEKISSPILTQVDSELFKSFAVHKFSEIEKELFKEGKLDIEGKWLASKDELAAFIWALKEKKYFRRSLNEGKIGLSEKKYIQSRYQTGDLARQTKPSRKLALKSHIEVFSCIIPAMIQ
jgi:hypothetical protein